MRPIHLLLLLALACRKGGEDTSLDTSETADTSDALDADQDGVTVGDGDCDDADPTVAEGVPEVCDGLDQDCDGVADDGLPLLIGYADADGDGFGDTDVPIAACALPDGFVAAYGDCDDAAAAVHPDAVEACNDLDDDCNGFADDDDPLGADGAKTWFVDLDGDGTGAGDALVLCDAPADGVTEGADCDDDDPARFPGATETDCTDPVDYNCDGSVGFTDADDDGIAACKDCDDDDDSAFPGGIEVCDGADNDCDATPDDGATDAKTFFEDVDADGFGDPDGAVTSGCAVPVGFAALATDCDDADGDVHPGADELDCTDPVDYNCDGKTGFADADADGFPACEDCRDDLAAVHPSAAEICDNSNVDEDCSGTADDLDSSATGKTTWYADGDTDLFGDANTSKATCDGAPTGYVSDKTDCDDTRAGVNPAKAEVCDGANLDENCNGTADDLDAGATGKTTWYRDQDGDTYGTPLTTSATCDGAPVGYVAGSTDCNDGAASINPGKAEVCDASNVDENCTGTADDLDSGATGKTTWYRDQDGDTYGTPLTTSARCDGAPSGYVATSTDCNDGTAAVNPSKTEVCDGGTVDENCDGAACGARVSPTLTSNVSSPPMATSDTFHWNGGGLMAWKAFNQNWTGWPDGFCWEGTGGWIQMDFGAAQRVTAYKIRGRDDVLIASPTQWVFSGSNDGSSFTPLDTRSGQANWLLGEHREFALSAVANYRYYRMTVPNGANSGYSLTCFQEMELFGG
jgi:large repetitive protein